jgi:hypothetical protein
VRRRTTPVLGLAAAALAGLAVTALSAPPGALPTSESKLGDKPVTKAYGVVDARGRRVGSASWRVTKAGGNCCEVLLMATRDGRLVEFGGTYPVVSTDEGRSWTEIAPLAPSTSKLPNPGPKQIAGGEGTIVQAPGGDIVGIGWDPYSGDRLQSFMYSAKDKKWYYQEAPLHEPFYDREWIAVAKGPFTIGGQTVPWISMVVSNFHRNIALMSLDGLNYFVPASRDLEAVANGTVKAYLPVKPDADFDYMQEQSQTNVSAVTNGVLSLDKTQTSCTMQTLRTDGTWTCFAFPNEQEITGSLHTDSRAWLHEVISDGGGDFVYRISKDGGRKWYETPFALPGALEITKPATWDFKVNGRLGLMAIAAHAEKEDHTFQDVVMTFDVHGTTPRLKKRYYVGDGNLKSSVGLDAAGTAKGEKSYRVDFTSIAILPDGRLAVSFADKTYDDPAIAILL